MRSLEPANEHEMVAAFLQGEIDSPRWNSAILASLWAAGIDRIIIDSPNIMNEKENGFRARLLSSYRGYKRNTLLFDGFPENVQWHWILMELNDLRTAHYGKFDSWVDDSEKTRLACVAADRIRAAAIKSPNAFNVLQSAYALNAGKVHHAPPILVARKPGDTLVILEGHVRITSYLVRGIPIELRCLIGYSESIDKWRFF